MQYVHKSVPVCRQNRITSCRNGCEVQFWGLHTERTEHKGTGTYVTLSLNMPVQHNTGMTL